MSRTVRIFLIILFAVALGYGIWWKLQQNKERMEAEVQLAMDQDSAIPVTTGRVDRQSFRQSFTLNGSFEASKEVVVVPTVNGQIIALNVRTGAHVREGEVLIEVDNEYTENELRAAELELKNARKNLERMENLIGEGGVTQRQYDEVKTKVESGEIKLQSLRKRIKDALIRAPISGHIMPLPQRPMPVEGGYVGQGNPLFQIVNVDRLKFNALLTAGQVVRINEGLPVRLTADVYPGEEYSGRVTAIGIKPDMFSKRYPVEIELPNSRSHPLRAGMSGKAYFELGESVATLVVPRDAFAGSVREGEVFVVKDGKALLRRVEAGEAYGNLIEVLSGLETGEQVVLSGQINLRDGDPVEIVEK